MSDSSLPEIVFPVAPSGTTALAVEPDPPGPINQGLAPYVAQSPATVRQTLTCMVLLGPGTRADAETEAHQRFAEMLDNPVALAAYGTKELQGVNALADDLLHRVEPVKIAELTAIMHQLSQGMRNIRRKYDVSDPRVRERYDQWKKGITGWLHRGHDFIDLLMEDMKPIERQLDEVAKTMMQKEMQLLQFVSWYHQLYKLNERELSALIYVIAILERVRELAVEHARQIQVGRADLGDRGESEKMLYAQFAESVAIKIADMKGRLMLAWGFSPTILNAKSVDVLIAQRTNNVYTSVIPSMKATLAQWRMLMVALQAGQYTELVNQTANEWHGAFFDSYSELLPQMVKMAESPSLQAETVARIVAGIEKANEGIIAAMEKGAEERAALDDVIVNGRQALMASSEHLSDAMIERVVGNMTKPREIIRSVPSGGTPTN